ncbi:hypothetical protein Tco_1123128 [Tanacetum coccineum]|uniref:Uncharacterized protein n=1 Tax=Tanacetum coccineum TaxID=301880 RepID=A0ABQ5J2H4_9ASTR
MAFSLLDKDKFFKIKQAIEEEQNRPEDIQELMLKLLNDLKICDGILLKQEEQAVQKDTILETESDDVIKSSVEDLVPIPSEFEGISDNICDVPFCDNDHFNAEFGLINSSLSRDISITSPKIDFLPEEFTGKLDLIDPILPGSNEDDFDEEEGEIDIDILQIKDEILCEKLLNVNLLIDKIEALNLTPSIPFVLKYPSSSPIPVVDSDFLIEEVDTFLVSEDSIPPGIESDFDSEGDIIFLDDLLNDDPIPEGRANCYSPNVEDDDSFTFFIRTFLSFLTYPEDSPLLLSTGSEDTIFDPGIFQRGEKGVVGGRCEGGWVGLG